MQEPARIAIDLGAESCRVSLLRWDDGKPSIEVVHRIPNGPVHRGKSLHWPLDTILAGLEEGLRKAAEPLLRALPPSASTAGAWTTCALPPMASRCASPSAIATSAPSPPKKPPTASSRPSTLSAHRRPPLASTPSTSCSPTPRPASIPALPGSCCPSTSSTGSAAAASPNTPTPPTPASSISRPATGRAIFSASSIFPSTPRRPSSMPEPSSASSRARWPRSTPSAKPSSSSPPATTPLPPSPASPPRSTPPPTSAPDLVARRRPHRRTRHHPPAFDSGYTNLGAATGDLLFHSLINSMWVLKQCMDGWAAQGRPWTIEDIVHRPPTCTHFHRLSRHGRRSPHARH